MSPHSRCDCVLAGEHMNLDLAEHIIYCPRCRPTHFRQAQDWLAANDPERPAVLIDPAQNIIIPRTDLPNLKIEPAQSGVGVVYSTGVANSKGVHTSVGSDYARRIALEWLAMAEDMRAREEADTVRKDEICAQFLNVTGSTSYAHLAPGIRPIVDRIYELEQKLNAAGGPA